jgi:hypothetical protein
MEINKKIYPLTVKQKNTTANNGFCASGADGKNISICAAIGSSSGRPISMSKRTNNQLFFYIRLAVRADGNSNFPPAQSPGRKRLYK